MPSKLRKKLIEPLKVFLNHKVQLIWSETHSSRGDHPSLPFIILTQSPVNNQLQVVNNQLVNKLSLDQLQK